MPKYRKLPVVIEAVVWDGNSHTANKLIGEAFGVDWHYEKGTDNIVIPTLEGQMVGQIGDYIIKGVNGEFYPCKPDIFAKTYEQVDVPDSSGSNQEVVDTELDSVFYDIQEQEKIMTGLLEKAKRAGCDGRLVAMANTDFERGFMALSKALNKTTEKD